MDPNVILRALESQDREPLEQAQMRHLEAQSKHLAESDRINSMYREAQARYWQEQEQRKRQQQQATEAHMKAQETAATWKAVTDYVREYLGPWAKAAQGNQHAQSILQAYRNEATPIITQMARGMFQGAAPEDLVGFQQQLDEINQRMVQDPVLRHYASVAEETKRLQAASGGGGLGFQERLALAAVGALGRMEAAQIGGMPMVTPRGTTEPQFATPDVKGEQSVQRFVDYLLQIIPQIAGQDGAGGRAAPPVPPVPQPLPRRGAVTPQQAPVQEPPSMLGLDLRTGGALQPMPAAAPPNVGVTAGVPGPKMPPRPMLRWGNQPPPPAMPEDQALLLRLEQLYGR